MENALEESIRIIARAREKGVVLRLIGGLAIRQHCGEPAFCDREYGDIDVVGLSHQANSIMETIGEFGYHETNLYTMISGGNHLLFEKPDSEDHIDVFLDKLQMEHDINLRDRLDIEENTISVSDLLISKLIIKNLNEKDYRDIITLVKDLPLGHEDTPKTINIDYIAELCSQNWGLSQDVLAAIDACMGFLKTYSFDEPTLQELEKRFAEIRETIGNHPKSIKWILRSYFGKRFAWRNEVELENA
jgi:hypothetical protein